MFAVLQDLATQINVNAPASTIGENSMSSTDIVPEPFFWILILFGVYVGVRVWLSLRAEKQQSR